MTLHNPHDVLNRSTILLFDCVTFGQRPLIYSFSALTPQVQLLPRIRQSARVTSTSLAFVWEATICESWPPFHSWWQEAERAELRVSVKNKPGGEDEREKETRGRRDDKESAATPVEQMFVRQVKKLKTWVIPGHVGCFCLTGFFLFSPRKAVI